MTGRTRRTAVAAVAASLGLTGAVLLAVAPVVTASASSRVAVANPDGPGAIDPGDTAWPTVDVTQTVTVTAEPTETADPVVTKTTTVTPQPTVTRTKTVDPPQTQPTAQPTVPPVNQQQQQPTQPPPVLPTSEPVTSPDAGQGGTAPTTEPPLTLAPASPTPDAAGDTATSFEEPTPDSVLEIRNASPEFDQVELSRQLAVPGILLVLLVIFAVFVFQGRLQRMAHAAAVRAAGPRKTGGGPEGATYPVTPAYAPIISFVPLQTYAMPPAAGAYPPGAYPPGAYPPGAYPPGYTVPQPGQTYPAGHPAQPGQPAAGYPQTQGFQQGAPYGQGVPGGYTFPQTGPQAGAQPGTQPGTQPGPTAGPQAAGAPGAPGGQGFPQQPYQTGQWPGTAQPWSGAGPAQGQTGGADAFSGTPGAGGAGTRQGFEQRPSSTGWFAPQGDAPQGGAQGTPGPDDEATSPLYDPSPRRALEPGPTSIPGPPVETISVERLGPDGEPMDSSSAHGTRVLPTVPDGDDVPSPRAGEGQEHTVPDPDAGEDPPPGKRRPWRRSK